MRLCGCHKSVVVWRSGTSLSAAVQLPFKYGDAKRAAKRREQLRMYLPARPAATLRHVTL
jgi:hypothetical protein